MKFIRSLIRKFRNPPVLVDKAMATKIAEQEAIKRGWRWQLPIAIHRVKFHWELRSAADQLGANVYIDVDVETGEILRAYFANH